MLALAKSKAFVLITDIESISLAELDSLTKVHAFGVIKHLKGEMDRVLNELFPAPKKAKKTAKKAPKKTKE